MATATTTTNTTGTFWIVPCGAEKATTPTQARDLYTSDHFAYALAKVEEMAEAGDTILILSARHGLVALDTTLAPYDDKMAWDTVDELVPTIAATAAAHGITSGSEVYAFLPKTYFYGLHTALTAEYVYPQDVYEAAPGIGFQRGTLAAAAK